MIDIRKNFSDDGDGILWDSTKDTNEKLESLNRTIHEGFKDYFMILCLETHAHYHKGKLVYFQNSINEPFGKTFKLSFAKVTSSDKMLEDRVMMEEHNGENVLTVKHYYKEGDDEYFSKSYYVAPYIGEEDFSERRNLYQAQTILWNNGFRFNKLPIETAVDAILKDGCVH